MKRAPLFLVLLGFAVFVSACGGGGGSGSSTLPKTGGGSLANTTGATVRVLIPKSSGTSSSARKPAFIASNTATITIGVYTVNGATPSPLPTPLSVTIATSSDCSSGSNGTSCTIIVTVPVATSVVLQLSTYDSNGDLLGQALIGPINTTLATIPVQSVSVGGVPATIQIAPASLGANDDGATHQIPFTVTALDASGNTIVQPGNYPNPIALGISGDTNHALSLSATSIASPGPSDGATGITLTYNSTIAINSATITATSGSVTASVPFAPNTTSGGGTLVAATPPIYEYATQSGGKNYGIAVGPDGQAIWFVDQANYSLGAVPNPSACNSSTCTSSEIPVPLQSSPPTNLLMLTAASDGNLYVTDPGNGGSDLGNLFQVSCTPSPASCTGTSYIYYDIYDDNAPYLTDVVAGPDGNLYISAASDSSGDDSAIAWTPIVGCCSYPNDIYVAGQPSAINMMTFDLTGQTLWFTDAGNANVGWAVPLPCLNCTAYEQPSGTSQNSCTQCGVAHRPPPGGVAGRRRGFSAPRPAVVPRHRALCCGTESSFTGPLQGIVAAPDGNIYVADTSGSIDQISPSIWESCSGSGCTFTAIGLPVAGASPQNLTIGPDGNVWFTAFVNTLPKPTGYVGFVSLKSCTTGTCKATMYSVGVGSSPWGIIAGPDGDIWFTDSYTNMIGKVVLQ